MLVFSSIGSPTTSDCIRATNRRMNSSATASATMNRFAAMHDCPLLIARAVTAVFAAASRSALGMTMNGSLPPSSSTVFLTCSPAIDATLAPAPSLPVSVAAATRSSATMPRDRVGADEQTLKDAARRAGFGEQLFERQRALRHVRRVLEQADVPGGERRRGEPNDLPEREVPRHHGQHDAERLERDVALVRRRTSTRSSARNARGVVGVVAASGRALHGFLDRGFDRLAHLERHEPAVLELALLEQLGGAPKHGDALFDRRAPPRKTRAVRRVSRSSISVSFSAGNDAPSRRSLG